MDESRPLRVVVFRGNRHWVAQCLDVNLAAQASDFDELAERFAKTLKAHIVLSSEKGIEPFIDLPQADDRYWKMWADAGLAEAQEISFRRERENSESRWNNLLSSFGLGGMRTALAWLTPITHGT
jgi:hypothetical protein